MDTRVGANARRECSTDKPRNPVKKKRPRRTFTSEFKTEAVRLCRVGDRRREERVLVAHVAAAFEHSRRTYGSPRIRIDLHEDGLRVGDSPSPVLCAETPDPTKEAELPRRGRQPKSCAACPRRRTDGPWSGQRLALRSDRSRPDLPRRITSSP